MDRLIRVSQSAIPCRWGDIEEGEYGEEKDLLAGPTKGAAEKAAIGTPLSSFLHRSASVPPTKVIGAEKARPSMARQTMRVPIFLATAQGMMKTTAMSSVLALVKAKVSIMKEIGTPYWDQ
jgi:hypothetical protein